MMLGTTSEEDMGIEGIEEMGDYSLYRRLSQLLEVLSMNNDLHV